MDLLNDHRKYDAYLTKLRQHSTPEQLTEALRWLCKHDLYFLLRYACNRADLQHPWLFDRCREVQANPNGYLDLWAREHYKDLADDTPVQTPDGIKLHGDLQPGDKVYSPTGKTVRVLATTPGYTDSQCYRITFDNGSSIVAGAGHRWLVTPINAPLDANRCQLVNTETLALIHKSVVIPAPDQHSKQQYYGGYRFWAKRQGGGWDERGGALTPQAIYNIPPLPPTPNISESILTNEVKTNPFDLFDNELTIDASPESITDEKDRLVEEHRGKSNIAFFGIVSVERVESVPTKCIQVEGGMYLAGNIPTSNSTIITFGLTLQDILNDPEITVGIFSHTRPIAKSFLIQLMRELEGNFTLKGWFPDVLYQNPRTESPKWSENDGIVVKRKGNPKESTVEAWGVVDGQPTSKHYKVLVYDDIVTLESVSTPDMMKKTTDALRLSFNLGARGGVERFIGTRYHFADTYKAVIDEQMATVRLKPATENGEVGGTPVFLDIDALKDKRRKFGPYVFACQMLQNPKADETQGFKEKWIRQIDIPETRGMNWYILVDAASGKRPTNDYSSIWAVGLGGDRKARAIPLVRDRLNLKERTKAVFRAVRRFKPLQVRYERYGLMADSEHIQSEMERLNFFFEVIEVSGAQSKDDRIKRLIPWYEDGNILHPHTAYQTNYEGTTEDLMTIFIEQEYKPFPVGIHDDMMDALSRLCDSEGVYLTSMGQGSNKKVPIFLEWPEQTFDEETPRVEWAKETYEPVVEINDWRLL